MATKLTPTAIKNLKPPKSGQVIIWDAVVSYFGVRIGTSGVKSFIVKPPVRMPDGTTKKKIFTIGRFSEADSLSRARETAQWYVDTAREGHDPAAVLAAQERERQREARQMEANSFEACRKRFIEAGEKSGVRKSGKPWSKKTSEHYRWALAKCSDLDDRPISTITRHDVQDLIDVVESEAGAAAAAGVYRVVGSLMSWCVRRGYIDATPCQGIEVPGVQSRSRVLERDELKAVWEACESYAGPLADVVRLLILTGQRRDEIAALRWEEVKGDMIELSGERTKNGLKHLVPLSPAAREIIEAQPRLGPYVFTTTGITPVSGFSRLKAAIDKLSKVTGWRIHDLRRTLVTEMNDMGIAPHVVEAVVNHVSGEARRGVAGVYNHAQYREAKTIALNAWADHITALVSGADTSNVRRLEVVA